ENPDGSVRRVFSRPGASVTRVNIRDIDLHHLLPVAQKSLAGPPPPNFQTASERMKRHVSTPKAMGKS
ncbi:MAG: hypothetical protein ABTQ27_00465, partial [Amaricoccus sp.]|uniref:hypothetical protein n=1 Tax=Amaricoccus sp. TaxID=1872485 RepID=UPI0033158EA3